MRTRGLELGEEAAIKRLPARTEVAGDKIALPPAMNEPRVLKKAAMDEAGRLSGFSDRATHAGLIEFGLAFVAAGPARRALEPRGQGVWIGEERNLLARNRHLADRDRFAPVRGDAGFQHRPVVGHRRQALKPRGPCRRKGAVGRVRRVGGPGASGECDHEKTQERRQQRRFLGLKASF